VNPIVSITDIRGTYAALDEAESGGDGERIPNPE
jgi:hypothetical protein